jgi:hypothetical protein
MSAADSKKRTKYAERGPCCGSYPVTGSIKPTDSPGRYEEFQGECQACHQMIGLVVGTERLKFGNYIHES